MTGEYQLLPGLLIACVVARQCSRERYAMILSTASTPSTQNEYTAQLTLPARGRYGNSPISGAGSFSQAHQ